MAYKGFDQVELRRPKRSMFDMSHERRMSTVMGRLTPCFITETLPNDTFKVNTEVLVKLAPLIAPVFHRINLFVHYFFVPNRLLWEDWEEFITGGRLGGAVTTPPTPPYWRLNDFDSGNSLNYLKIGSVLDYLGFPVPIADASAIYTGDQRFSALPAAAFYKIYQDYYRDRNYEDDTEILPLESGNQQTVSSQIMIQLLQDRYRKWQHDYFTSALPFTQRGPEVLMPLEGSGSVTYLPTSFVTGTDGVTPPAAGDLQTEALLGQFRDSAGTNSQLQNIDEVNMTASNVSINDLRRATALQMWLERNALAGSRYSESIMAHFGRRTSDGRLQRAEYLGGGRAVIKIDEIMTTAYSEDSDTNLVPPGNPSGAGKAYANQNGFRYNCEEHGFIIGILSVRPTSGYMEGIPRMFTARRTFLDYPWPTFAHLGEQPVYDHEIFMDPDTMLESENDDFPTFGYQSRYAEWKNIQSSSHGDFRTTLDYWHLTRKFGALPSLDGDFVTVYPSEVERIFNVASVDNVWLYIYNQTKVVRSLPYFGTPKLG